MSAENVAAVRRFVDAFNRQDFESLAADLAGDVELSEWPDAPGAHTYHGPEGVAAAIDAWFETWEWMTVEIEDIEELGDRVMVTLHQRARGRGSQAEVEIRSFNVYTFRDGKVLRIQLFTDREAALAAFGAKRDNVDMVRASFAEYEDGDFDALLEMMHPDLEVQDWPEGPDSRIYRGMDGLMQARAHWAEAWESVRGEPKRFIETGDRVFVFVEITAKGRGSSIEMKLETFGVFTFRDARVWKVQYFTDRETALAAAGLTEEQTGQEET